MSEKYQTNAVNELHYRKLFDLSKSLMFSLDIDEILQATVEGVATLAGLDTAAIYLLENESLRLNNTTPPLPPNFPEEFRNALLNDHPHIKETITTMRPVFISDVNDAVLTSEEKSVMEIRHLRTLLFLPLIVEKQVLGAFIIGSVDVPRTISEDQIDLSGMLASIAALAVKNAKLYHEREQYAEKLEKTLIEREHSEAERKKLQEQLMQSQKMQAVGQLAGGIAHDFNNMLCGIIGNAEILHDNIKDEELSQLAHEIITIGQRSGDLTAQLLAFSRKGQLKDILVDLDKLSEEVINILKRTVNRKVEFKYDLNSNTNCTKGDPAQIQSAILNLCLNARDAMQDGGILSISTKCVELNKENDKIQSFKIKPGQYIELIVKDTGHGMEESTVEKIFEPFFTTKKKGEGTGMGLSAVYGTVVNHQGAISVDSAIGEGTTFKLYFPLVKDSQHLEFEIESEFQDQENNNQNLQKRVLVVDDEELLTRLAYRYLREAGFNVDVFIDSVEALSFFKENYSSIDLVILDMIIPQMDGTEFFYSIKEIKPEIDVIIASGYSMSGDVQKLLDSGAKMFIQKPYRRKKLIDSVKTIIQNKETD